MSNELIQQYGMDSHMVAVACVWAVPTGPNEKSYRLREVLPRLREPENGAYFKVDDPRYSLFPRTGLIDKDLQDMDTTSVDWEAVFYQASRRLRTTLQILGNVYSSAYVNSFRHEELTLHLVACFFSDFPSTSFGSSSTNEFSPLSEIHLDRIPVQQESTLFYQQNEMVTELAKMVQLLRENNEI